MGCGASTQGSDLSNEGKPLSVVPASESPEKPAPAPPPPKPVAPTMARMCITLQKSSPAYWEMYKLHMTDKEEAENFEATVKAAKLGQHAFYPLKDDTERAAKAKTLTSEVREIKEKEARLEAELAELQKSRLEKEYVLNAMQKEEQQSTRKTEDSDLVFSLWEVEANTFTSKLEGFIQENYPDTEPQVFEIDMAKRPHGVPTFGSAIGEGYRGFGSVIIGVHSIKDGTSADDGQQTWSKLGGVVDIDSNKDGKVDRAEWEAALALGNSFAKSCEEFGTFLHGYYPLVEQGKAVAVWETSEAVTKNQLADFLSTQLPATETSLYASMDGALGVPATKFSLDW